MYIGIISYLPKCPETRRKRLEAHKKQIEWLRNLFGEDFRINIVSQNYENQEYFEGINYFKFKDPIGASSARNILLKDFYASKDDFILLLDDDCILYDYYGGSELLLELQETPKKFKGINSISSIHPKYEPFKKENYLDKNICKYWKFEKRPINSCGAFTVYSKTGMLFDEEFDVKREVPLSEDLEFHIRFIKSGFNSYRCRQWILKEMSGESSVYWSENRVEEEKKAFRNMLMKTGQGDLISENGRINYAPINEVNRTRKVGYIKRKAEWEYTEKEIPKKRSE